MGLETLSTALDAGDAYAQLTEEDLREEEKLEDSAALKIVIQDATVAERYISGKNLPEEWNNIDELYRAVVKPAAWQNGQPRASLSMPVILESIENILSQVHMAFFSDPQPFSLSAKGKTDPKAARAASKILCWALKVSKSKEEFRKLVKNILLKGQGVGKFGWQVGTHEKSEYKRGTDGKVTKHSEPTEVAQPTFEFIELPNVLVDPSLRCHDIRDARFVIHQMFVTADDLDNLDAAGYKNVPTRDELLSILVSGSEPTEDSLAGAKTETDRTYQAETQTKQFSANPLNQPLEILEYWTNEQVITVLQRKIVLRNEVNEFGRLPFVSCSLIDVIGSWFGFGVGKLIAGEQQLQAGVVNAWIDSLALKLNPMYHRKKGVGATSQSIQAAPGRVVNDDGDLTPLETPDLSSEAMNALASSEARATKRVAANFGQEMPSQVMRTAEGVNAFSAGIQVRLQYFIENFAELVFIPVLESFVQLCKDKLQPADLNNILSDEEGKAYEGDALEIYNGAYSIEILSSTKLAARRAMAALLPQLVNLFVSDPIQQSLLAQKKKINYAELVQQAIDLTGWPVEGLIVDATDEDMQRAMAMNPAVVAAQSKSQIEDQKHQNEMELEDNKATGRAGVQVVRHLLDSSKASEVTPLATALEGGPLATQPPPGTDQ